MRIERTIEVATTPAKAYKVLADPTNIPRYMPDIEDVVVTNITPRLVGTKLRIRTREAEMDGEVTAADAGKACAYRMQDGRLISWDIQGAGRAVRLVNVFESVDDGDEARITTELERKLRTLRNAFQVR